MEVLQLTSRKRETYDIRLTYSTLWESALGIAAITNSPIIETLERPEEYWQQIKKTISTELLEELNFVEENNTWKSLLQLLHEKNFNDLTEFTLFIKNLNDYKLKFICLPFVANKYQSLREKAALGEENAIKELIKITSENPFFPQYIAFICGTDTKRLKEHLIKVMTRWHIEVSKRSIEKTSSILKNDYEAKRLAREKMKPEELVQWATGGIIYHPEPSVHTVLLIPQYIYRPWNIEADIEGTKVFYYPVSNESITPYDKYTPSNFLVLKYKALGDDARLRIVKLLSERSRSLQDLTEQLNIGKSTIHHHLKTLRAAKLVEIIESKYSLREGAIELLYKELDIYLKQK